MPPKITNKIFMNKTFNSVHEKKVDTNFSQPLQWILCEGRLAKNLNFVSKIYHRVAKKSDRILQKKSLKNHYYKSFKHEAERPTSFLYNRP